MPHIDPTRCSVALALVLFAPSLAAQDEPVDIWEALKGGRTWVDLRYRLEHADQDGLAKDAWASTLRTALGYETLSFAGFRALVEFEDVSVVGDDEAYATPFNGVMDRPVIPEVEGGELNQSFLAYATEDGAFEGRVGRQKVRIGRGRFFGDRPWRQNHTTYDAVSIRQKFGESGRVFAAFLDEAQTAVGGLPMATTTIDVEGIGTFGAYWHYLDFDDPTGLSTSTVGARLAGSQPVTDVTEALYAFEYADQKDAADNPRSVDQAYWRAQLGAKVEAVTVRVTHESLGGSQTPGDVFSSPLALQHAFHGWADVFLTNALPTTGLEDTWISVEGDVAGVRCAARYHDFGAQATSADYGSEIDLLVTVPVNEHVSWTVAFADYDADGFGADTRKLWTWLVVSF